MPALESNEPIRQRWKPRVPPPPNRRELDERVNKIITWIEKYCFVPEGADVGKPLKLRPWQKKIIRSIYGNPHGTRRAIITMGRKNAKPLEVATPIPTPNGWSTIGDIKEGDYVFGSAGQPVKVLAVSRVFRNKPCYAVGFSDGSSITATHDHRWMTKHAYRPWAGRLARSRSGNGGRWRTDIVTTEQIAQSLHRPRADGGVEHNHKLPCAPALHTTPVALPIPPYVFGVWLGNGDNNGPGITIHQDDLAHHTVALQEGGEVVQRYAYKGSDYKGARLYIKGGLGKQLRVLGLLRDKHIPELYHGAGLAQRWALLQGLMDTDGTVNRHAGQTTPRCSYSSSSWQLAYDVWRLARSLGLKATITESEAKIYDQSYGPCWRVSFPATSDQPIFKLARKQNLLPENLGKRSSTITITSCEKVETVPTKCLMVDAPDNLFLAGHGCVPTHNTAISALILLVHLCGPESKKRPNAQLYSSALSREQASLIFNLAAKIVRMSAKLSAVVQIHESRKGLSCPELGTSYRALSADASTAMGLSPSLILHDELGQVRGPRSALYESLETAVGAQKDPLSVIISTQAPTDADLLSVLIDDAKAGHDPRVVLELWAAPMEDDPFTEATIRKANPAFGDFLNAQEVLAMAEDARRMPAREAEFRNLVLNQRVVISNPFVSIGEWKACTGQISSITGMPVYAGLDLSSVADLTALVLIGRIGRQWHVHPTFWLPGEGLREKAMRDRVPYDTWAQQGFLQTTPGNSVSYEYVADYLRRTFDQYNIAKLAFDRWNMRHLKPWLIKAGFTEQLITEKFVEFGQGTQSMSPALRDLEQAIKERELVHGDNPVMNMCAACAVVESKDDANRKLSKNKSTGRIDGLQALAMAFGVAPMQPSIDVSTMIG